MGTRSRIIAKLSSGHRKYIYVHWDGHPDTAGVTLNTHYQNQEKIDQLIGLGDLSVLGAEIGVKTDFDNHDSTVDQCIAYGRDRGEKGTQAHSVGSIVATIREAAESGAEFVYCWDGEKWEVTTPELGLIHNLADFLKGGLSLTQTVKAFGGGFVVGKRITTV